MSDPNALILLVESPVASAAFYQRLLGKPPVEESKDFAMFIFDSGAMFGLWARADTVPPAGPAGGSELCWSLASRDDVDTCHARWQQLGVTIIQSPVDMDFGHTFTAVDPDGHRLRVFAAGPQA